jgi:hypothetical protein
MAGVHWQCRRVRLGRVSGSYHEAAESRELHQGDASVTLLVTEYSASGVAMAADSATTKINAKGRIVLARA